MGLESFARSELDRLVKDDDPMQLEVNKDIMQLVKTFAAQGHSGFSAGYTINVIEKLLNFEPLSPLTGEADEWNEIGEGKFQNKRCPSVFRNGTNSYDIAVIGTHYAGDSSTCSSSVRYYIHFPYKCGKRLTLELPAEAVEWSTAHQIDYVQKHRGDSADMEEIAQRL